MLFRDRIRKMFHMPSIIPENLRRADEPVDDLNLQRSTQASGRPLIRTPTGIERTLISFYIHMYLYIFS